MPITSISLARGLPVGETLVAYAAARECRPAEWFVVPRDDGTDAIVVTIDAQMIYGVEAHPDGWALVDVRGTVLMTAPTLKTMVGVIACHHQRTSIEGALPWNSTSANVAERGMST